MVKFFAAFQEKRTLAMQQLVGMRGGTHVSLFYAIA